jgi:glycosyltransferase involved in cell wall biosynthesis
LPSPLSVTALAGTAELGGAERVLLDFANRAFEHEIALRVITPMDGPLVGILNRIGVPAEVLPASPALVRGFRRERWFLPSPMFGLYRWAGSLSRHRWTADADVVYSVAFRTHLAARLGRLSPVVWHLHRFPPRPGQRYWLSAARNGPTRLIANSEIVAQSWRPALGDEGDGRRLSVIHNGVNLDRFRPRESTGWIHDRLGLPRGHRLIGMPALFARWKGHLEVLRAFERIAGEFPDVHLVIVGGSTYQTDAEHRYGQQLKRVTGEFRVVTAEVLEARERADAGDASEGLQPPRSHPRVHMLPFQREIELAFPEFDLTVHYSVRPEPFGRVVLESMACAIPVVAAAEGGPLEILGAESGARREAGWLAPPRSPEALATVLRTALSLPPSELHAIGGAGRVRAEDHFSSRTFAGHVAGVLREAAGAGP